MSLIDRTAETLQGFFSLEGERCPYVTGTYLGAWFLGRVLGELGREMPAFVRVLDGAHLEADGVAYQFQELDGGLVAIIPVSAHVAPYVPTTAPTGHLARENAQCRLSQRI